MSRLRWLLTAGLALLLLAAVWLLSGIDFEWLVEQEQGVKGWIDQHIVTASIAGLAIYTLLSLAPGLGGKALLFGWLFGFWISLLQVSVGLTAAAVVGFLLSRWMFQDALRRRFPLQVQWLDKTLATEGPYLVMTLRLVHAPYTLVNYTLGATTLRTRTFWWSTQLGMLPSNVMFVYAGSQLPSLDQVGRHGASALLTPHVLAPLLATACLPFGLRWLMKRFRSRRLISGEPFDSPTQKP